MIGYVLFVWLFCCALLLSCIEGVDFNLVELSRFLFFVSCLCCVLLCCPCVVLCSRVIGWKDNCIPS